MGCDIHVLAEKKVYRDKNNRDNGVWLSIDKWMVNDDKIRYPEDYVNSPDMAIDYDDRFYRGRNYFLFYVLAGVRGSDSWGPRIADPKGIPDDCCIQIKTEIANWGEDGHSHSYLTLTELLNFDWNAKVDDEDLVRPENIDSFIRKIDPDDLISNNLETRGDFYSIHRVKFKKAYKDFFPAFMDTIARMNKNIEEYQGETADDIRLVFFFDN